MGINNTIDWTAATIPQDEQYGPGLKRKVAAQPAAKTSNQTSTTPASKRSVMDTLPGENSLVAVDPHANDPYNATGRRFRR